MIIDLIPATKSKKLNNSLGWAGCDEWPQSERRWFQEYWWENHGTKFFKELPDGRLVSW